jgi:hypothetical protein
MSKADEFRQYADDAMRRARQSETEKERLTLIELALSWTQAAAQSRSTVVVSDSPPGAGVL